MKKKIMTMLISALCLVTASLNSVNVVGAADEETNAPILMGDLNDDSSFNVADVVLLQKWLLAVPNTHLANWKAANFCEDDRLDVFDLTLMKRALLAKMNERSSISLQTYDAYKEFVEQNDLPEGFVEYEQVKAIGSFNSLVFLSDARNADYSEYMYGFSEPSKNTVFLTIVPSSKENTSVISTSLSIDDINQSDMRFTKNKEVSGIFKIDDLSYKYIKGTLLSITWEKNDLRYTLSCASTFSDYQLNQDTFTSKLLVYETAGNTFKQFDNNEAVIIPDNPERSTITLQTYDTYKEFTEQNDLPEGFVEYEQVKAIGSFNSLVFLSDARNADYSEYMYGFTESSKNTVFLTIVPSSKEKTSVISTPLSIDDINQSDMRFTKNEGVSGIFKVDNLSYKYINGILLSITWENSGLRYSLSCSSTFSDYQLNQDTFTSKLLVYETAGNTFKQFDNNEAVIIPDNPERSTITLQTYNTYKEFIEQNDLPEEFVEFEKVEAIGSFNSLVFLTDARNADYSEYMYGFNEPSKNTVFLTIVPSSKKKTSVISTPLSTDDIDQSDMRFTQNKEVSGIFKVDNLSYKYIKGTLLSITWENNDLRYTLSCASTFSDYQLDLNTYISKLLVYEYIDKNILF